ncbi:MAG: CsgG/HfaB family protein [Sulfurimonas sp.]|uniref:CsgG/HfaB family protein n=1 Tax=Sulfurimonas sp. TaxID=2022749 RepID=UPI0025D2E5D6|nr:CsgG/HfaB family protein [Sulfurimonas sp.]MCK9491439.1 CsgG/HfaB family protein [Sulfurimonas sp.]
MMLSIKSLLVISAIMLLMSGCAQKVKIKALNPAEVEEMATKKKIAISSFKNDHYGLSGKIESQIAQHKLDQKRYFTVVSRKDLDKVMAEQKLQSSELMDEKTATKVGKLIGAQAVINGEIASASGKSGRYIKDAKECLNYTKKGCTKWRYYKITCHTTQATVAANINIVNVETGSIIYGDTLDKEYSADSCNPTGGFLGLGGSAEVLSKAQALNRLTSAIASEFVYKLTPNYIYFEVALLDKIEVDVTKQQETIFENSLEYIKVGRMDRAESMLQGLLDELNGRSYVVAYVYGVVQEAEGKLNDAKKAYTLADDLAMGPVEEINLAIVRINNSIEKRERAKRQMNAK